MTNIKKYFIYANLLIVIVVANILILKKENTIKRGELILLKLTPIDPRSLLQGDYMYLNYEITRNIDNNSSKRGFLVVATNIHHVAEIVRLQPDKLPLNEGEILIKYFYNSGRYSIGSESFFFEEGHGTKFENAIYGELKVDKLGNMVLTGLCDGSFEKIVQEK